MKLTKIEMSLLKKMGQINESASFYKGNKIWTNTPTMEIIMCMDVQHEIPCEFHVLFINRFISAYNLIDGNSDEDSVRIVTSEDTEDLYLTGNGKTFKIKKSMKEYTKITEDFTDIPYHDVQFQLTEEQIKEIKSSMSIVDADHVVFSDKGISVQNSKSHNTDKFVIKQPLSDKEFRVHVTSDTFGFLIQNSSYTISVMNKTASNPFVVKFQSDSLPCYYLFVETTF